MRRGLGCRGWFQRRVLGQGSGGAPGGREAHRQSWGGDSGLWLQGHRKLFPGGGKNGCNSFSLLGFLLRF